jgi:hypothetical protein
MKISAVIRPLFVLLIASLAGFAQDPLPVLKFGWEAAIKKAQKVDAPQTGPARLMTVDDTNVERTNRAARTDHPDDPTTQTPDGRRALIEKNEEEAKTVQPSDVKGFTYSATVRNESTKVVRVVYWEYQFTEIANPANTVRRQFLCSVNLKKEAQIDLSAFSTLGPTDTISAATPTSSKDKLFTEKVQVNRIEYADDDILQRGNWKLADVKAAVERATATPWGKEMCRPL